MKTLQKLQKMVASVDQESLTSLSRADLQESISEIIDFLTQVNEMNRGEFSKVSQQLGIDLQGIREQLSAEIERHKGDLTRASGIEIINNFRDRLESIEDRIQARLAELKDGKDGISPDIEEVVQKLIPFIPKGSTDTGIEIRNKLEHLEGDERLSVDAIAGLEEKLKKNVAKGGGPHALSQLMDVDVVSTAPTNGQLLAYDSTLKRWKPGTAGAGTGDVTKVGTPVDNQVGVWTGDGTLEGDTALTFDTTTDHLSTTTSGKITTGSIELGAASDTTITRSGAGTIAVEGVNVLLSGGALGTPSSGTLTNCTGLPVAGITASTTQALGVGSIELGHASDTSITRVSAGVAAIEGKNIALNGTTETLTTGSIELGAASDTTISRASAGVIAVEGKNVALNGTTETLTTGTIELGAASDTTISRASAGVIAVEGNNVLTTATGLPLSGGTMTGSITLGENTGIALDPAGSADGKWSGITVAGTAGYAQTFGDLVYLDPTDSRWEKCDANSAAGADGDSRGIIGIVVSAGAADGSACTILLNGIIRADAAFPTFTVNNPIYVSETAGAVTQTQPTTTDVVIRIVGSALTTDEMYFNPDWVWITHT